MTTCFALHLSKDWPVSWVTLDCSAAGMTHLAAAIYFPSAVPCIGIECKRNGSLFGREADLLVRNVRTRDAVRKKAVHVRLRRRLFAICLTVETIRMKQYANSPTQCVAGVL